MKHLRHFFLLLTMVSGLFFTTPESNAQAVFDYGNGWVDATQPWIKLRVWEDGVYRVTAQQLAQAGFDTNSVNPNNLHLFYRGIEKPIYVEQNAGRVSFLEFYGLRNDGRVDSTMYRDPYSGAHANDIQPNKRISLFSDTSAYFLTWDNTAGLRVTDFFDGSYAGKTPEPYFPWETYFEYHPTEFPNLRYNWGGGASFDVFNPLNSYYITGEGYCGKDLFSGGVVTIWLPSPYAANTGGTSKISGRVCGLSSYQHILEIKVRNQSVYWDTTYGINIKTRSFNYSGNLSNSTKVQFYAHGTQNNTDYNKVVWASMLYDRLFNLDGDSTIKVSEWFQFGSTYMRWENCNLNNEGWIWDLNTNTRIRGTGAQDTLKVIVPGHTAPRDLFVVTDRGLKTPLVEPANVGSLTDPGAGAEFVIISHPSLTSSAEAYREYRDTCTTNPFASAKVVYVEDIYNEFGYGTVTPLAIKRFCKYAMDNWTTTPKYFFLWGKGQYETRAHPFNLVPTFGYPASDYGFVGDFDNRVMNPVPLVPIGRVNVQSNTEGLHYLEKVNIYEHSPWQTWMKQAVFLGGGEDTIEQKPILTYLNRYRSHVERPPYGGKGYYWQKFNTGIKSNAPNGEDPADFIDGGVGIIHFFGHSTNNIYDVDIQEPYLYQNWNRFPLMLAFGCYGGDFTGNGKSFGERFVLENDRGSIGYLANSTAGYLVPLGQFGEMFYPVAYDSLLGSSIGSVIQRTMQQYFGRWRDQVHVNHAKQLNLQGDPAIKLYNASRPDLSIVEDDVWFEPANFSASDSSFTLNMVIRNLAIVAQDSFILSVRQMTPQGSWIDQGRIKLPPIVSEDTVAVLINNPLGPAMAGLNVFDIFVDSTEVITELREDNNRLNYQVVIPGNVPGILSPYDFAVIDSNKVKLAASALVMSQQQNVRYIYEIDTDIDFNTPNKRNSGVINGTAVYSEWEVPFTLKDSTVYYWRVRLADVLPPVWVNASFKYIPGKRGWAQSDPPQFFRDPSVRVSMDQLDREWEFDDRSVNLHAWVKPKENPFFRLDDGAFRNIDVSGTLWGIMYTSIDPVTLRPGASDITHGDWRYVPMPQAEGDLINAIQTAPDGTYFLIMSQQNAKPHSWGQATINSLYKIGVDTARFGDLQDFDSFIIFGRKGFIGQAAEVYSPNVVDSLAGIELLDLRTALHSSEFHGNITSTIIGPSVKWNELIWDWKSLDQHVLENTEVQVRALRADNSDSLIYTGLARGTYPLSGVDHTQFPYMRLSAVVYDSTNLTAPQLDNWHVINEPAPDIAVDPITDFTFDKDTVLEGQTISLNVKARNVSDTDMDSLLVSFRLVRPGQNSIQLPDRRYSAVAARQEIDIPYEFGTGGRDLSGDMFLRIELNPNQDQVEQHLWNNVFTYPFHVLPDKINPILDVTIDGKHLMDGDLVSPKPEILIEINDDNPYLAVSDTAFEVWFGPRSLTGSTLNREFISGNPKMETVPAQLPDNKGKLYFRPDRLADGEYTLRVQGFDFNGNPAGELEYEINFEVVNQNAVSEVLNYPNPFSSNTRFVYTLTGDQIPERFEIHIYTISGKLVKVIDLLELGEVRFGYNITDYSWDGTDEFGDMLANGVYVYKVVTSLNGENMEVRDEGISDYFNKNGFGKMYIMR